VIRMAAADPVTFTADDTFTLWGDEHRYFDHPYNTTLLNDRAVEVPVALRFVEHQVGVGVEIGNVLSHYTTVSHRVVDRWEEAPGVENIDVFDVRGPFDWIVAVSTLEHVRKDEPDQGAPWAAVTAVEHLRHQLAPGGELLVTVPFGQNPYLDGAILGRAYRPDREATMMWTPDGWLAAEGLALWRPVRPRNWAGSVWFAMWCG